MGESDFDLRNVTNHLRNSKLDSDIQLADYILSWKELNKMFSLLGRLFSFVQSDVTEKVQILEAFLNGAEKDHFETVDSMIQYELAINRTQCTKPPSGCRTLLRLHRAQEYVVRLIHDMNNSKETDKMSSVARKAYDETLAQYHPWLVKKGVHLAVRTLPRREKLIESVSGHMTGLDAKKAMEEMVESGNGVYDTVQTLYLHNQILDLP